MSAAAIERLHGRVLAALETHYGAASQTATQDEAAFDEATYMRAMTVADRVRDWLSGQGAGAKKWLLEMWADWLPRVVVLGESEADRAQAQALADELKGQWAGRGLKTVLQQQNLMTDTRNLLKALDPQHPALRAVSFSTAEYVAKTAKTQDGLEERLGQTVLLSHEQVEALTRRAVWLLGRTHWAEIAAGLVAVTGRRSSEILATATFEPVSRWSVSFSGQLKRRGVLAGASFEIPTLAEAALVALALGRVRSQIDCSKLTARQVNQKYGDSVVTAVAHHFAGLLPTRETAAGETGGGNDAVSRAATQEGGDLYTHLFRSVFGAVALHRYCPKRVNDHLFLAEIQGHRKVLDERDEQVRRSYVSTLHYDDYRVVNEDGSISKGTWLGEAAGHGVEVLASLERFAQDNELGTEGRQRRAAQAAAATAEAGVEDAQEAAQTVGDEDAQTQGSDGDDGGRPAIDQGAQAVPKRRAAVPYRVRPEDRERLEALRRRFALPSQAAGVTRVIDLATTALDIASTLGVEPEPELLGRKVTDLHQADHEQQQQHEQLQQAQQQLQQLQQQHEQAQMQVQAMERQLQEAQAAADAERLRAEDALAQLQQARGQIADLQERIKQLQQQGHSAGDTSTGQQGTASRTLVQIAQQLLGLSLEATDDSLRTRLVQLASTALLSAGAGANSGATQAANLGAGQPQTLPSAQQDGDKLTTDTTGSAGAGPGAEAATVTPRAVGTATPKGMSRGTPKRHTAPRHEMTALATGTPKGGLGAGGDRGTAAPAQTGDDGDQGHHQEATQQTRQRRSPGGGAGGAEARIAQAAASIIEHNERATAWADKWAITQSALSRLTGAFRPAIQRYLAHHQPLIDEHHQKHQIAPLHNGENHRGEDIRLVFGADQQQPQEPPQQEDVQA